MESGFTFRRMNWMHPLRIALNYGVRIYFPKNDNKFNSAQVIPASLDETRVIWTLATSATDVPLYSASPRGTRRGTMTRVQNNRSLSQCSGGRYLKFLNSSFPAAGLVWFTLLHPEEKREFELQLQLSAQCSGGRHLMFLNSSFPAAGLVWFTLLHPKKIRV